MENDTTAPQQPQNSTPYGYNPVYGQNYQQALAKALQQQAATPIQYQQTGAVSPLQGLNKGLQGAQAGYQLGQARGGGGGISPDAMIGANSQMYGAASPTNMQNLSTLPWLNT